MARSLFGGALSATVPPNITDISELREIPDNQEVFVHPHTDQSIIIELMEFQAHVEDAQAARYHFEDLSVSNKASSEGLWEIEEVEPLSHSQINLQQCRSAWLLRGAQTISKYNEEAKNIVNIHLCVFRLPQYTTDILVTFNDPTMISAVSSSAGVSTGVGWSVQDFLTLLQTLTLLDAGLFG